MEKTGDQNGIIELLAGSEETIGRLYAAYAQKFPVMAEFWQGLADDEHSHALWIRSLKEKLKGRELFIKPERFKPAAILSFVKHTEKEITDAGKPGYQLINALSMAFFIEESLIEKKYFEAFAADSAELTDLLHRLEAATRKHAQLTKEARDKYNRQNRQ